MFLAAFERLNLETDFFRIAMEFGALVGDFWASPGLPLAGSCFDLGSVLWFARQH